MTLPKRLHNQKFKALKFERETWHPMIVLNILIEKKKRKSLKYAGEGFPVMQDIVGFLIKDLFAFYLSLLEKV